MKRFTFIAASLILSAALTNCSLLHYHAKYVEPNPRVDTHSRPVSYQDKKQYPFNQGTIVFDNLFDMARMNDCVQVNDSTFTISILPENTPINGSPWYAFRVFSEPGKELYVNLLYTSAKHRYLPKISSDGNKWISLQENEVVLSKADSMASFHIHLTNDTTWIAGQELYSFKKVLNWCEKLSAKPYVVLDSLGVSKAGRPLIFMDIESGKSREKPILVITARQHPPEVTGHLAMKSFVETLLEESTLAREFRSKYHILVYPILNPDGVDLGHWRHNTGGIDLNRDWGNYNQPEIRQIADHIVTQSKRNKAKVVLGLDFHSTYYDIFYTNDIDPASVSLGNFKTEWFNMIDQAFPDYSPRIEPGSYLPVATSKTWFYAELHTEGIIYEVGDKTPRDFIAKKAQYAADAMMQLLLKY